MESHKMTMCGWCEGKGTVVHYPARGNPFASKPYEVCCPECDGEGYVEIDTSDADEVGDVL